MLSLFAQAAQVFAKFAIVLSINVSLFLIVPVTHTFLSMLKEDKKQIVPQRRIVAEMVKRKEEKQEQRRQRSRIRSVSNESARPAQSTMKFKFTPDLSVAGSGDGVAIQQQQLEVEVFEEGDVDENISPVNVQAPPYPDRARELAVEGTVLLTFVVYEDGRVGTIESIDAPHPSFAAAFRKAIQSWKFKPAMKKGVPVKQRVRWPVDYVLD
ncbi:MAG: TonB family protein [Chitinivibrionales bacterium]|nr:TonB family protein [Chitinivibrionales bacterium]MBD3394928.1 TonB family protein [Chitinivibrionales bacterium]